MCSGAILLPWIAFNPGMDKWLHYKAWDEITLPFPNFNGFTVEVWKWISNFISHCTGHEITYPCLEHRVMTPYPPPYGICSWALIYMHVAIRLISCYFPEESILPIHALVICLTTSLVFFTCMAFLGFAGKKSAFSVLLYNDNLWITNINLVPTENIHLI